MSKLKGVVSTLNVPCIEVTWQTPNFAQTSRKITSNFRSPPFSFARASWCLVLVPCGVNGNPDVIRIFLERLNSPISEHSVISTMGFNTDGRREKFESNEGLVNEKKDFLMLGSPKRFQVEAGGFLSSKETVAIYCYLRLKTHRGALLQSPVNPVRSLDSSRVYQNIAGNSGATYSASSHPNLLKNSGSNLSKKLQFDGQVSTLNVPLIEVTWEIPNFVEISKTIGYEVESPPFSCFQASWCLELVPNGGKYLPDYMFIGLKRLDSSVSDHSVIARMGFKTDKGEEHRSVHTEGIVDENHDFLQKRCESRSYVEARGFLLPKGTVTVFCQLELKTQPPEELLELPVKSDRSQDSSRGNQIIAGNSRVSHPAPAQLGQLNSSPPTQLRRQPNQLHQLPVKSDGNQDSSHGNQIISGNSGASHPVPSQLGQLNSSRPTELRRQPNELHQLPVKSDGNQDSSHGNQNIVGNSGATHPAPSQLGLSNSIPPAYELHPNSSGIHNLQSEYKKLLDSEKHSDVCLKVSDKEFRAHKCILGARSSAFSAMFEHDTKEKNSGEVVIEDLDPESFPDFLQHVYAGSVDTLSKENVFSLYRAADKYDMADLKSQCKSYMERTLSVDTFCDVMVVALRYKEDELLKAAIDFFSKNLKKIIVTVKWQLFSKEHNTEANELLIKALAPADQK